MVRFYSAKVASSIMLRGTAVRDEVEPERMFRTMQKVCVCRVN